MESGTISMASLEEEIDESGHSMLDAIKGQASDKTDDNAQSENGSATKIKVKSLNSLVSSDPKSDQGAAMSDFTIGDIVEHGDFVGSDESGVMHLKITNVMSVDESITGCTIPEDDKDAFANIQIASVTTLLDDEAPKDKTDKAASAPSQEPVADSSANVEPDNSSSLKIVQYETLKKKDSPAMPISAPMCVVSMCIDFPVYLRKASAYLGKY